MPGFEVDEGALQFAGSRLGEVADDLESDFAVLRTQMDRLLDGGWSGGASRSFATAWSAWVQEQRIALGDLRRMAQLLTETSAVYARAESATRGGVRAIVPQPS